MIVSGKGVSAKHLLYIWWFLFVLSIVSYFSAFKENFKISSLIKFPFYYHFWVSLDLLILSILFLWCIKWLQNKTNFLFFRSFKYALIFFIIADILVGIHNGYCEICSNLGLCGSLHNYPDAATILIMCLSFLSLTYLLFKDKKEMVYFQKIVYYWVIAILLEILVISLSTIFISFPEPISYKKGPLNWQGFIFINLIIYCMIASWWFLKTFKKRIEAKIISLQFFLIGISQIPAAYHLLTCYWCHVEECSEFFGLAGICLMIMLLFLTNSCKDYILIDSQKK